ncbi:MAG: hypothetical protein KBF88_15460, partial [Polyangiaceae bacterium]|nr:hypothetical protein [Polyangiaceae bacterium]
MLALLSGCSGLSSLTGQETEDASFDAAVSPQVIVDATVQPPSTSQKPLKPAYPGPFAYPLNMFIPIVADPSNPEGAKNLAGRLGYLRRGGKVPVIATPHANNTCSEGWYELVAGGFVCGKYVTLDANHPTVRLATRAPNMNSALPYDYGYNLTHGAPIYRRIPSRGDRAKFEPWLKAGFRRLTDDDLDGGTYAFAEEDGGIPWYLRSYDGGKPSVTL